MKKPTLLAKRKSVEFEFEFQNGDKKTFIFTAPSTKQIKEQIKNEENVKKTSGLLEFKENYIKNAISGEGKEEMIEELLEHGNIYDFGLELTELLESEKAKK